MTIAANIGDVAVLDFEACFPDSVVGFVPWAGVNRDYLFYMFRAMKPELMREAPINIQGKPEHRSDWFERSHRASCTRAAGNRASFEQSIADLNSASERAEREISLLREYCTRLISDVVTGKLDVRSVKGGGKGRRGKEKKEGEIA